MQGVQQFVKSNSVSTFTYWCDWCCKSATVDAKIESENQDSMSAEKLPANFTVKQQASALYQLYFE